MGIIDYIGVYSRYVFDSKGAYYRDFDKIQQVYSSVLTPMLAEACAESVRKLKDTISRKQELIDKNKKAIDDLTRQSGQLQRRYEDALALQKIKEISQKVNL